jgi:hypothetical protein
MPELQCADLSNSFSQGTDLQRCQQELSEPTAAAAPAARGEPASPAPPPAFPSCLDGADDGLPALEQSASPRLSRAGSEAGSPGSLKQAWRPLVHEAIDDACARAGALAAQGVEVQMFCSFIEVGGLGLAARGAPCLSHKTSPCRGWLAAFLVAQKRGSAWARDSRACHAYREAQQGTHHFWAPQPPRNRFENQP